MAGKKKVLRKKGYETHRQPQMKIVTVETCINCPTRCARGIHYMERMEQPGAVGYGVPCILTLK